MDSYIVFISGYLDKLILVCQAPKSLEHSLNLQSISSEHTVISKVKSLSQRLIFHISQDIFGNTLFYKCLCYMLDVFTLLITVNYEEL